jgi:NAD(P)-dependent dehydrogenase (short-subunit alcohol dehydrogenase family)
LTRHIVSDGQGPADTRGAVDAVVRTATGGALPDVLSVVGTTPLLTGQTVILTGAGGGIGGAVARTIAAAGARLAVTDLDAAALEPIAAELHAAEADVLVQAIDASDRDRFAELVARVDSELGPVDGLVNCAGLWTTGDFCDIDAATWDRVLAANLGTAVSGCRAVIPGMTARGRGSIVNFASTSGEYGSISAAAHYAAAKGGVIALTKTLAREVAGAQVRVNAVSPGPTDTVALGLATPEQKASVGARTLFGRLGRPEEIAAACVFLLSPLSTFITGHVLRVNGGSLL